MSYDLVALHTEMLKTAELEAEAKAEEQSAVNEIVKYASAAEELLSEKFGDNYDESDVIGVASHLIDTDITAGQEAEKYSEYDQLGRIMADSFAARTKELVETEVAE